MMQNKIKSYAKLNVALNITGKNSSLHKIESIVVFVSLHDEIFIKKIKSKSHNILFSGKFSRNIGRNNTVSKLLEILEKKKLLKNQKFQIRINKKIPTQAGLGGGSMNAASIIKYLQIKQKINLKKNEVIKIISKIGSDVVLGMNQKNSAIYKNNKLKIINKNFRLFALLVKPNFGCSTSKIYKNVKNFSISSLRNIKTSNLNKKFLSRLNNDLEKPAFNKYKKLKNIKNLIEKTDNVLFARMTGSGSTIIGYFNSKKTALNARKIIKKNYKNYWCNLSKTI